MKKYWAYWILHLVYWVVFSLTANVFDMLLLKEGISFRFVFLNGFLGSGLLIALLFYLDAYRKLMLIDQIILVIGIMITYSFLKFSGVFNAVAAPWKFLLQPFFSLAFLWSIIFNLLYVNVGIKKKVLRYETCQIIGWSLYCAIYIFFYLTLSNRPQKDFFTILLIEAASGLVITHFMRMIIKRLSVLKRSLNFQIRYLVVSIVLFSPIYSVLALGWTYYLDPQAEAFKNYSFFNNVARGSFGAFLFLLIWNLIYFTYHYILKTNVDKLDKIRLETLVRELELKTIKAHINPHFIFNALNSIRALVDENPLRARTAITQLSNLLRSSLRSEHAETTELEKELNLVKDYLALEHIRFEDRLKVDYQIAEDTLDMQVPPMMLQTLVENAIKHGISKQIEGGNVHIKSEVQHGFHVLLVENSGALRTTKTDEGFGISSTESRLKILYGPDASFQLRSNNGNVIAQIKIPLQNLN